MFCLIYTVQRDHQYHFKILGICKCFIRNAVHVLKPLKENLLITFSFYTFESQRKCASKELHKAANINVLIIFDEIIKSQDSASHCE